MCIKNCHCWLILLLVVGISSCSNTPEPRLLHAGLTTKNVSTYKPFKDLQHLDTEALNAFIQTMIQEHDFPPSVFLAQLKKYEFQPSLIRSPRRTAASSQSVNKVRQRMTWDTYRNKVLTPERILKGKAFIEQNRDMLENIESDFSIPASVVVAIIGIETNYGNYLGQYPVFDTLLTRSFHPHARRKQFFKRELESFLVLTQKQQLSIREVGSKAGAIGVGQFMPSSYKHFAIDYDQNNRIDFFSPKYDAVASVANYLKENGWQAHKAIAYPLTPNKDIHFMARVKWRYSIGNLRKNYGQSLPNVAHKTTGKVYQFTSSDESAEFWLGLKNYHVIKRYNNSNYYALSVALLASELQ